MVSDPPDMLCPPEDDHMCTVSIVPREDGFRLVCNRDERRTRPAAVPPRWHAAGHVSAAYPLDPQGGGTWVAVSGQGLAVALLNRGSRTPAGSRSRGEIPLALVGSDTMASAGRALTRLDVAAYPAFLVLVVWFDRLLVGASDGVRMSIAEHPLTRPLAFTSSSLGDRAAEQVRLPLFWSLVGESRAPLAAQQAFHDHQWPACPELSVRMTRPEACTVSRTRIDVRGDRVALDYEPLASVP